MEKKDLQYIDSELKKIKIKDFEYVGMRKGSKCVFAYEHKVDDNDKYAIVLNGEDDRKVEIEAETDYNSGGDEYIDKILSLGSWQEAIEYLKNKEDKLVKSVQEKYEYHKKEKAKSAKVNNIASIVTAGYMDDTWTGDLTSDYRFDESRFSSDVFQTVPSGEKGTVLFALTEKNANNLYQEIGHSNEESKYIAKVIDKAYQTFENILDSCISNKTDVAYSGDIVDLFSDHVLDLSRIDDFYDKLYTMYGISEGDKKEDYDKERDAVKSAIEAEKGKLENAQDIDFKVKIVFKSDADESNRVVNEDNQDRKEYSEYNLTVTVYGILDGNQKQLWSMSKLIDSYKNEYEFLSSLDNNLVKWFGIHFSL